MSMAIGAEEASRQSSSLLRAEPDDDHGKSEANDSVHLVNSSDHRPLSKETPSSSNEMFRQSYLLILVRFPDCALRP